MKSPPRILYLEDDDDLRCVLERSLSREGFHVTPASCAEDALALLERGTYAALVTDYRLPGENAPWLLREANARGLLKTTRVIVLSSENKPPGVDGYPFLKKPVEIGALTASLNRALSKPTTRAMRTCLAHSRRLIHGLADHVANLDDRVSAWGFPFSVSARMHGYAVT